MDLNYLVVSLVQPEKVLLLVRHKKGRVIGFLLHLNEFSVDCAQTVTRAGADHLVLFLQPDFGHDTLLLHSLLDRRGLVLLHLDPTEGEGVLTYFAPVAVGAGYHI